MIGVRSLIKAVLIRIGYRIRTRAFQQNGHGRLYKLLHRSVRQRQPYGNVCLAHQRSCVIIAKLYVIACGNVVYLFASELDPFRTLFDREHIQTLNRFISIYVAHIIFNGIFSKTVWRKTPVLDLQHTLVFRIVTVPYGVIHVGNKPAHVDRRCRRHGNRRARDNIDIPLRCVDRDFGRRRIAIIGRLERLSRYPHDRGNLEIAVLYAVKILRRQGKINVTVGKTVKSIREHLCIVKLPD